MAKEKENEKIKNCMITSIQELKNEAIKSDVKVSELLRKAKIIAKELDNQNFLKWIEKEADGYSKNDKVPEYRLIYGEPKGWNPCRGWVPFIHNDPEIQDLLSKKHIVQSVAELEILVENKNKSSNLQILYPAKMQAEFSKSVGIDTKFSLFISPNTIYGILNIVRNKLIDWLIEVDIEKDMVATSTATNKIIFPGELIEKLPKDLKVLADDFNFNFSNGRPVTGMLILRRILPLSIVRKFQKLERETEIKDSSGDYFDTKALLGKVEGLLSNKRIYSELMSYKILIDSSQHSYTLNVQMSDTEGVAIKLRVFLDDIF